MRLFIGILAVVFSSWLQAAESFLDESERATLTPHPEVAGVMRYVTPGTELGSYEAMLFGSVTLYFDDDSKEKGIDADEVKAITDALRASMVKATANRLTVAEAPGPKTALINLAITEIKLKNKKRGLLGYTPVGFVATAAADAAGLRVELKQARIEGELVDSVSGDVIAIFRVKDIPKQDGADSRSWDDVTTVFEILLQQGIIAAKK